MRLMEMKAAAKEWLVRGLEFSVAHKFGQAVDSFLRGIEVDPGNSILQMALGSAYSNYSDRPNLDRRKAMYWWRKAAEQGHAIAQCLLANGYESGDGVPLDMEQALYWYRRCAQQGCKPGQSALTGDNQLPGSLPLPLAPGEADIYRKKVSEWRWDLADEIVLAPLDPRGIGVPCNLREGLDWYCKAVEQRDGEAQQLLWENFVAGGAFH
jgi:TPR repeat protein